MHLRIIHHFKCVTAYVMFTYGLQLDTGQNSKHRCLNVCLLCLRVSVLHTNTTWACHSHMQLSVYSILQLSLPAWKTLQWVTGNQQYNTFMNMFYDKALAVCTLRKLKMIHPKANDPPDVLRKLRTSSLRDSSFISGWCKHSCATIGRQHADTFTLRLNSTKR